MISKTNKIFFTLILLSTFLLSLSSCRKDIPLIHSTDTDVSDGVENSRIKGFFLLNEGNKGSNKATLDYFDYTTGKYHKNIYAERNPGVIKELGDVGNDLRIWGNKLYAVINCSNFVEVMDLETGRHISQISIPNCRYITFKDNYAYVSSYAGPIEIDPNSRLGYVAKIDTASFEIVGKCTVGYQPEQMAIVGDKLYVANSGGYRVPNYDQRVSVIDLNSFQVIKDIDTKAINLHKIEAGPDGKLYVSSRGDYENIRSKTIVIDTRTDELIKDLPDLPNSNMSQKDNLLYVLSNDYNEAYHKYTISYNLWDMETDKSLSQNFITDGTEKDISMPYGIAVNPESGEIFVTDAKNYVTPGKLHCYDKEGKLKWSVTTGDIPAHIAFSEKRLKGLDEIKWKAEVNKVFEYTPAPGQFINEGMDGINTPKAAADYALNQLERGLFVSLGGFGGYIVMGFDHSVRNSGGYDIQIGGNSFDGSSEPGIVYVMQDKNRNGLPDDTWYELKGSEYGKPETKSDYAVTYTRPIEDNDDITWIDNYGNKGVIEHNKFHSQSYYPAWIEEDSYTLSGTCLNSQTVQDSGIWKNKAFDWGYSDNFSAVDKLSDQVQGNYNHFRISDAVTADGKPAMLQYIDFVKVQTGVNAQAGSIGEVSTEVFMTRDYNIIKQQ